jgi:acyl-CoA thioesterase
VGERFSELTAVRRTGTDGFDLDIDPSAWIVRGPNGGYIAAVLLRAMTERLDDGSRAARSLTVHYPAAPSAGPATITTEAVRVGRSLATLTARLEQGGRAMAIATAAFSPAWSAPSFADEAAPEVRPASDLPRSERIALPFLDYWDQRIALGAPLHVGAERADSGGWLRLAEPEPVDAIVVAAMADAWPPAIFTRWPNPNPVPTVDLTVHFRTTLPSPLVEADDHVLVRFRTHTLADGFLEEDGQLWAPNGTLLAQSRQLAIVLPG